MLFLGRFELLLSGFPFFLGVFFVFFWAPSSTFRVIRLLAELSHLLLVVIERFTTAKGDITQRAIVFILWIFLHF